MTGVLAGLIGSFSAAGGGFLGTYVNYSNSQSNKFGEVGRSAGEIYVAASEDYLNSNQSKLSLYSYSQTGALSWSVSHSATITSNNQRFNYGSGVLDVLVLGSGVYVLSSFSDFFGSQHAVIGRYNKNTGALESTKNFGGGDYRSTFSSVTVAGTEYILLGNLSTDKSGDYHYYYLVDPLTLGSTYTFATQTGGGYSVLTYQNHVYLCTANSIARLAGSSSTSFTQDRSISGSSFYSLGYYSSNRWVDSTGKVYVYNPDANRVTKIDFSTSTPTVVWSRNIATTAGSLGVPFGLHGFVDGDDNPILVYPGSTFSNLEPSTPNRNKIAGLVKLSGVDGSLIHAKKVVGVDSANSVPYTGEAFYAWQYIDKLRLIAPGSFLLSGRTNTFSRPSYRSEPMSFQLKTDSSNYSFNTPYTRTGVPINMQVTVTNFVNGTFSSTSAVQVVSNSTAPSYVHLAQSIGNSFFEVRTLTPTQSPQVAGYGV